MIQNFIVNALIHNSECDNVNCLSVEPEDIGNLITKRNLIVRVDVSSISWSDPTIRFNPTIYTRGLLPYKNPPLSWIDNRTFRNKTSIQLEKNKQSDFEPPIQFLIDWAQKYGAYEGYFVYNKEKDPWCIKFDIEKNQWIRDEERIDKVKNLESKLRYIKSNKENIASFISGSISHKEYQGYHDLIKYYTQETAKVTDKIKTHKRLLGMNVFRI
jgi:hypothetical protein